ncbi:MAG: hypothetical protein ACXVZV_11490 [Terriglobales bacterium]
MAQRCETHDSHSHQHGSGCGHTTIQHEGHTDYLHDGHMHNVHEGHVDEHRMAVSNDNPERADGEHRCDCHAKDHTHGAGCGHEAVPHGNHTDYLVEGHLHHQQQGGRCESHGSVNTRAA